MKKEVSAGGVIVRKRNNEWEILLIKDMNRNWTFPKGRIEAEETTEAAAKREIQEETGLNNLQTHASLSTIHYMYQRNGLIDKTVYYFLFVTEGNEPIHPQKEEGISEIQWISFGKAEEIIGYRKTNLPLLKQTEGMISG